MRCPDCSKFVSQDTDEPQVDSLDLDGNEATASVTISVVCAECSGELKSGQLDLQGEFDQSLIDKHQGDGCQLEARRLSQEVLPFAPSVRSTAKLNTASLFGEV